MNDRPPCDRESRPHQILVGLLSVSPSLFLFFTLILTISGCSPSTATSEDGVTTSKVPEIAKRQKHMADMLKKAESKATTPTKPH
jgi:hypothetical protein